MTLVTTNPTDVLNLVWDFAPFAEQVSLQDPDEVPAIDYNGLTILGAKATDGKDYLYTGGAHFNGAGTAGVRRCIIFTPEWDALLTVTFHSNNSNERRGHIAMIWQQAMQPPQRFPSRLTCMQGRIITFG